MPKAVQDFIPIKEIRDGVVLLKNGQLRSVLLASSVNFDLKSADEQEAIIMQYQNFLNSLDFSVQFFIQSRRLDIKPYLNILEERLARQTTELIKIQTREYIEFIKNVTGESNIMSKTFFIVVPFIPTIFQNKKEGGFLSRFLPGKPGNASKEQKEFESFEENRSQLEQRKAVVVQGLARIGIRTIALGTEELIELFYKIFNPGDSNVPTITQN